MKNLEASRLDRFRDHRPGIGGLRAHTGARRLLRTLCGLTARPANTEVAVGQSVTVQATASDSRGITRLQLLVDGKAVHSVEAPGPQPAFSAVLPWKAEGPGSHVVSVRYFTRDGVGSEPVAIMLIVASASAATATPLAGPTQAPARTATAGPSPAPTKAATATVAPTVVPPTAVPTAAPTVPPTPIPCRYVATFVGETIPDGTVFLPGAAFTKIWRVRNDGNCPWPGGFQFGAIDGERMTSVAAIAVPDTVPGGIAALAIGMTAPAAPGGHGGRWQLRTAGGAFFGPILSVSIVTDGPDARAVHPGYLRVRRRPHDDQPGRVHGVALGQGGQRRAGGD